jgi:hypothetical protein
VLAMLAHQPVFPAFAVIRLVFVYSTFKGGLLENAQFIVLPMREVRGSGGFPNWNTPKYLAGNAEREILAYTKH